MSTWAERADDHGMPWWGWVIAVIWGPGAVATAVMIVRVVIERSRARYARRHPVTTDRRRPENAVLREVAGPARQRRTAAASRGLGKSVFLEEHTVNGGAHNATRGMTAR